MEQIILGLLACRDLTVYEIKKAVEQSISFFFSASYGTLHPAVRRLVERRLVSERSDSTGPRLRKIYSITEAGRGALSAWLDSDIQSGRIQEEGLLKVFFFANIPRKRRLRVLKRYREDLVVRLQQLRDIESAARKRQVPAQLKESFNYQMMTASFGLAYVQFEKRWYDDLIMKIEKGEI